MQIISVPTVFTCKTPHSGWLNLALVRQLHYVPAHEAVNETGKLQDFVVLTWLNGDKQPFLGDDATAIVTAWNEAQQRCECNYRTKNRRTT